MRTPGLDLDVRALGAPPAAAHARVDAAAWTEAARRAREKGRRLVSLWGSDDRDRDGTFGVFAAYAMEEGLVMLELRVRQEKTSYPGVDGLFPAAALLQRAVFDLLGVTAEGAGDSRPWLRHGAWPEGEFPLRRDFAAGPRDNVFAPYPFVRVEGDGVHEIPVGPIHAGIIEPGHFRFSVVGEKVLRLEARLGYTHKGIDKRFEAFGIADGYKLAGRISGDSTVAYAWAYAQAAEALSATTITERAAWMRALALERERVANHLGDLGALGNDGGFGFALSQFMRLKEDWLRESEALFGHRFMMDAIVPGGVAADPDNDVLEEMGRRAAAVEREVRALRAIFDEHSGLQDRFITAGRVTPELARQLGLVGLAGRASGQANDLRVDFPCEPYGTLGVKKVVYTAGDVAARVHTRFDEVHESLRLVGLLARGMPYGETRVALPAARPGAFGVGWVEGWRGEVFVALEAGEGGRIRRCHAEDPSAHNWPVVPHAVMGNIVPDFPLINKSFNLSYSGNDL